MALGSRRSQPGSSGSTSHDLQAAVGPLLRWARLLAIVLAPLLIAPGCTPPFETLILYPEFEGQETFLGECELALHWDDLVVPDDCVAVGDVYVGESGSTSGCGKKAMVELTREKACRSPANLGVMARVPDWNSTCFNIRTRLFLCESPPPEATPEDGAGR